MINILYIHGLGSSSESSTGRFLGEQSNEFVTFYHPSFSASPKKALSEINEFIKSHDIQIVIGSSMGGFYALQCNCLFGVVVNPALTPIQDIKKAFGYGEFSLVNAPGTYEIDESFYQELEEILMNNYGCVDGWFKHFPKSKDFCGLFGADDNLFSHYEDFHSINEEDVVLVGDMGHRLDEEGQGLLKMLIDIILARHFAVSLDGIVAKDTDLSKALEEEIRTIEASQEDYKIAFDAFVPYWEETNEKYLIRLFKDEQDLEYGICCYAEPFEGTIREAVKRSLVLYFRFSEGKKESATKWTIVPDIYAE